MRHLELKYINSFHPNTNGGRAVLEAKKQRELGGSNGIFMSLTILRGLGFDVKLTTLKDIEFIETTSKAGGLDSPLIVVKCKEY